MLQILRHDLHRRICQRIRSFAIIPIGRDALSVVESPAAFAVALGAEEGGDGGQIRDAGVTEGRKEFVEKGGGAVEKE